MTSNSHFKYKQCENPPSSNIMNNKSVINFVKAHTKSNGFLVPIFYIFTAKFIFNTFLAYNIILIFTFVFVIIFKISNNRYTNQNF